MALSPDAGTNPPPPLWIRCVKCVIIGDAAVGKTYLLTMYAKNEFLGATGYVPRVHIGHSQSVMNGKDSYRLNIFDTAGASDYNRLRPLSYPQTDVFLVCFSVGNPSSLANVKDKWFPEARHYVQQVPCVVAATQIDLRDADEEKYAYEDPEGLISTTDGKTLARELGAAAYVECSAKTGQGVKEAFDAAFAAGLTYEPPRCTKGQRGCIVV
ncbi:putative small GTPase Cdc42 [Mycena venus]|uniref:Putative small GTPase Cdc42 n=1 Tax=Mycena venus TaxID=2733690 RepID=A0A8H7CDD0_9AGAR|nr:putative small GTPase Cdc42 [Mycena venus]